MVKKILILIILIIFSFNSFGLNNKKNFLPLKQLFNLPDIYIGQNIKDVGFKLVYDASSNIYLHKINDITIFLETRKNIFTKLEKISNCGFYYQFQNIDEYYLKLKKYYILLKEIFKENNFLKSFLKVKDNAKINYIYWKLKNECYIGIQYLSRYFYENQSKILNEKDKRYLYVNIEITKKPPKHTFINLDNDLIFLNDLE